MEQNSVASFQSRRKKRDMSLKPRIPSDRISELPDYIVQHILSFLPWTKEAIKTCVLSKRWQYQWTRVPLLIFDSSDMSIQEFFRLIDKTLILHDCPTIIKLVIRYFKDSRLLIPHLPVWIRFATRKQVKKLTLLLGDFCTSREMLLPQILFNNDSLIKLKITDCNFAPYGKVNWPSLKVLCICSTHLQGDAIENVISGSPLLESLQLDGCGGWSRLAIASKSLKRLVIDDIFELYPVPVLETSCPNLEELNLSGTFCFESYKVKNLPCSTWVTLDFHNIDFTLEELEMFAETLVEGILRPVQCVEVLYIGEWLVRVLSALEVMRALSCPLLNTKCLTLDVYSFAKSLPGIACLLHNSTVLDKLIMKFSTREPHDETLMPEEIYLSYDFGEKYWNSHEYVFNCLVSHLKTIEVVGLNEIRCEEYELVLKFLEYLLKNARVLEGMVLFQLTDTCEDCRCGQDFVTVQSKNLLSIPRGSPQAIVDVLCCKAYATARGKR